VVVKEENPRFVELFSRKFPNKEEKLIIGCSDGKSYCLDALDVLDEAGYVNLVALKGGYYTWFKRWDNNLRRWATRLAAGGARNAE
jgi:rhodanese-related sulfurtransferase